MTFSETHRSPARSEIFRSPALLLGVPAGVALVVVCAFLAYFPSLNGGFILDDDLLLTENQIIKASDGLYRIWCTTESTDYWPMTYTTLWIEWRLWGMNSTAYHITNLILHIIEALLIWIILRKMSIPGAFLAAIIFAVHPVNVESVAWISQRKNMMAMLFFLLSILCYLIHSSRHSHPLWYWLSLATFVLAMLSKGSVAVLPVLLLGIVWWRRPGTVPIFAGDCPDFCTAKMGLSPWGTLSVYKRDLLRIAPFFLVAFVLAGVNVWFQTHGTEQVLRNVNFTERLLGACGVVEFYLYKAIFPIDLAFVYPQWHIQAGNPLWWLPLVTVLIVTAVLWRYRESWSRPLLFAWVFYCVSLLPVMGFIDVGFMKYSLVADHYQHIAIVGVIVLVAAGWSVWHERVRDGTRWAATAAAIVALAVLTFLTWRQCGIYSDTLKLYQATLEKNPACWMAHNNLGNTLLDKGRPQEAIEHYLQALRLKPDFFEANYDLGNALMQTGRHQEAIKYFQQALQLKPDNPRAYNNLGNTLAQTGRLQEAIEHYERALRVDPDYSEAHNNLGGALFRAGRFQEAIEHYEKALRGKPDYPEAHNNLGAALSQLGRHEEAIDHYQQALRIKPDYHEAHNNLGNTLRAMRLYPQAIDHYKEALRLKPDFTLGYFNLALAYAHTQESSVALAAARKALELARSQGQTAQAKQIEDWMNTYRAGIGN